MIGFDLALYPEHARPSVEEGYFRRESSLRGIQITACWGWRSKNETGAISLTEAFFFESHIRATDARAQPNPVDFVNCVKKTPPSAIFHPVNLDNPVNHVAPPTNPLNTKKENKSADPL